MHHRHLVPGEPFVDRYEVKREVGRGAYGAVYDAADLITGDRVALKLLHPNRISLSSSRWREAASLRRLRIPGVASLLNEGYADGRPYVVMEFVEGEPFPTPRNPVSWQELRPLALRLLEVLSLVHVEGVVHGDLKPSNVKVAEEDVVLLDFGLATSVTANAYESVDGGQGTPVYMAPELFRDQGRSPQSDLFAVGTMLFEALTGRPFFLSNSLLAWIRKVATEGPPKLATVLEEADPEACRLVDALLEVDRGDRPGSATEALHLLRDDVPLIELPWTQPGEGACFSREELATFFAGPEPGFHLQTEPARIVWERTLGHPPDVAEELEAWRRAGMAHIEAGKVHMTPRALQMLREGLRPRPPLPGGTVSDDEAELLSWIRLAEPLQPSAASELVGRPKALVAAELAELSQRRLVRRTPEGWWRVRDVDVLSHRSSEWLEQARRRILERSDEPELAFRLSLLVGAEFEIAELASRVARSRAQRGDSLGAHAAYRQGVMVLRAASAADERGLLREWGVFAAWHSSVEMLEEVLWAWGDHDHRLRELLEAHRHGLTTPDEESARVFEDLAPFADPNLEALRLSGITIVSRWYSEVEQDAVKTRLRDLAEVVDREIRSEVLGHLAVKEGFKHYANGEFRQAAEKHLEAAELALTERNRLSNLVNAGWGLLDAFEFDGAQVVAERALTAAAEARQPDLEIHCELIKRFAEFRSGRLPDPSDGLLLAAREVGYTPLVTVMELLEGVVSWRRGDSERAARVTDKAARRWTESSKNWPALLVAHLNAFVTGRDLSMNPMKRGRKACPYPRLKAQMLALASYFEPGAGSLRDEARGLVPVEDHSVRLECFSIDEIEELDRFG